MKPLPAERSFKAQGTLTGWTTNGSRTEFHRNGGLQMLLLRYTQALITQMSQTAVCNRHHTVDQQLCRWLLLSLDRLPSNQLVMTQELIANMLGVRREGVSPRPPENCRTSKFDRIRSGPDYGARSA